MPYRYLEDIATGDAAFEAEGRTLEELFREAARFFGKLNILINSDEVISIIKRKRRKQNDRAH